ncbi:MAG TPA: hypothetical protein PK573_03205 [Spirochaetota bacterium]|nr:hypothetical protein [Spirochaetota bacterium]HRZ27487.1 hypothetical protein [Spirochaetota bacterium]
MSIITDIDMMITEYTREGLRPKYIVIGFNQFKRWNDELKNSDIHVSGVGKTYQGCDVVLCSSDIIEVVGEAAEQFRYMLRKR